MLELALEELLYIFPESKPFLIGICSRDISKALCNNIKNAIKEFRYAYDKIFYVEIPALAEKKSDVGCMSHPNVAGQRYIADSVYPQVRDILEGKHQNFD